MWLLIDGKWNLSTFLKISFMATFYPLADFAKMSKTLGWAESTFWEPKTQIWVVPESGPHVLRVEHLNYKPQCSQHCYPAGGRFFLSFTIGDTCDESTVQVYERVWSVQKCTGQLQPSTDFIQICNLPGSQQTSEWLQTTDIITLEVDTKCKGVFLHWRDHVIHDHVTPIRITQEAVHRMTK